MPRILIIEDEAPMRTALVDCLASEGHRVLAAADGETGLSMALKEQPDLVLLDVMMPKVDGFSLCAALRRAENQTPILMLTAKSQVTDRVAGLDSGADDYLVKPFSTEELLARIRALLRRGQRRSDPPTKLRLGNVRIDFTKQRAWKNGKELHLTAKELLMLRFLAANPGEPISRERFLDVVWGYNAYPTTRTVDNHIATLRQKIEPAPDQPRYIITVHGVGYRFDPPTCPLAH